MISALITDFDGTLVDTFEANFKAYQEAFHYIGKDITEEEYHKCFGFRFERFMEEMSIYDEEMRSVIKEIKKNVYPKYFNFLRPNQVLISLIESFREMGGKTAIASTARKENLMNAVEYLGIANHFDLIFTGVDVKQGKPSPEIYLKAMDSLKVSPKETIIFEDSQVGITAAKESGAQYIVVTNEWFK